MKKYIFFDVDGTLSSKWPFTVSRSTKLALKALKKNGHFVSIATGRPYHVIDPHAKSIDIDTYVCNGGSAIVEKNKEIVKEYLDQTLCMQCLEYLESNHIPYAVSCNERFRFFHHKGEVYPKFLDKGFIDEVMEEVEYEIHSLPEIERICIFGPRSLLKGFNHDEFINQGYESGITMIEPDYKYKGIEHLMDLYHYPKEDVVVFGDGENDIKMFEQAPFSIAMGNGVDSLKKIADYVTTDIQDDGILNACIHFGWIKKEDIYENNCD